MRWNLSSVALVFLIGCSQTGFEHGMEKQAKKKPLQPSAFFTDGRSARPPVPGTVARGHLDDGPRPALSAALLARGRERFNIYCAVCHDRVGTGNGMIVRRGFPHPPSFHETRLRQAPDAHFYDVITNGYGRMYPYRNRVSPEDRWAITAYIRALQRSQHASLADVPPEARDSLEKGP